jgi:hypothetical protein
MAQTEHLPIYKAAYDLCLYLVVRNFSRHHEPVLINEQASVSKGTRSGRTCVTGHGAF